MRVLIQSDTLISARLQIPEEKDYKTKESMSRLSDHEVETALAQPPIKRKALSKEDADGLKEIFGVNDQDLEEAIHEPKHSSQVDSGSLYQILMEAIQRAGVVPSGQKCSSA